MNSKAIVIGGTGMLGLPVARRLKKDGFQVTIISSHPYQAREKHGEEFTIVEGDVTDAESLRRGIEGQKYVHVNLNAHLDPAQYQRIEIDGTYNVAKVAREMGVARISNISSATSRGVIKDPIYLSAKVQAEQAIIESGVPYSIMRPSWFFEILPIFIKSNRAVVLGEQPNPLRWLSADDFARQVSRAYQSEDAANRCFYNLGPEPMTISEAVIRYCALFHPSIHPEKISFGKAKLLSHLPGGSQMKPAIPFFEFFNTYREDEVDSAETDRLLGNNETTLDVWLKNRSAGSNTK